MKKYYMAFLASLIVCVSFAAHVFELSRGDNTVGAVGEVVAVEANTVLASQSVKCSVVTVVGEYTNAYRLATAQHTRYDFTITNFDGNAAVKTNTLDKFSYHDWMRGTTNLIVGNVSAVTTNIDFLVSDGKLPKAYYFHTNEIVSGTASSNYLKVSPANTFYYLGGTINVDCGTNDSVRIMIK